MFGRNVPLPSSGCLNLIQADQRGMTCYPKWCKDPEGYSLSNDISESLEAYIKPNGVARV